HGSIVWWSSLGALRRDGSRTAPSPGNQHCWRFDGEPGPHAVYDARHIRLYGPAAAAVEGGKEGAHHRRRSFTTPRTGQWPVTPIVSFGITMLSLRNACPRSKHVTFLRPF